MVPTTDVLGATLPRSVTEKSLFAIRPPQPEALSPMDVRSDHDPRFRARAAGIVKHATVHTLRHSFASQLLASGTDIRTIQLLLGHRNLQITMIHTHVLEVTKRVTSPLDAL